MADITSPDNQWVRLARSLHRRRQRYRERAILVEGIRPVRELIHSSVPTRVVLYAVDGGEEVQRLIEECDAAGKPVRSVPSDILNRAADTETPQGILAVSELPELEIDTGIDEPLLLIADRITDPGNLGTLIRSAHGAGAHGVLVTPGTVDPYSPKVVRAGMGSHFRLPIVWLNWESPPDILARSHAYAALANATTEYDRVDWTQSVALIVGNETNGPSDAALSFASETVGIPLAVTLESLNVAVAGSVVLFEAARQRRKG